MTLFSRLQKLNKEATDALWHVVGPPWNTNGAPWINAGSEDPHGGTFVCDLDSPEDHHSVEEWERVEADAQLIVECRNSLPAVLNLIEAAQYAREQSQQLIGMDDPFGSQGPPMLIGANAWFELADAVAVFVSGQEAQ